MPGRQLSRVSVVSLLAALLAVLLLAAACGGASEAGADEPQPSPPPAGEAEPEAPPADPTTDAAEAEEPGGEEPVSEEPVRGGTLRIASEAEHAGVGPHQWGSRNWSVTNAIFDRLWELSEDGTSLVPGLAVELPETTNDGRTYVIRLREGVTFHDGTPFTAEDVKYSIERQLHPDNGAPAQGSFAAFSFEGQQAFLDGEADSVPGIRVVDPLTLEITLDAPSGAFPFWMTMGMASIVPKGYGTEVGYEGFERNPIGTGPYQVVSFTPGESLVLERYDGYWRDDVAWVDRIEWTYNVEPSVSILRIIRGEQDMMFDQVPSSEINALRDDPDVSACCLQEKAYSDVLFFSMSLEHEALQDLQVRQAVHHAMDKEKLVRQLAGLGEPATGGLFSPLSPYWQEDFPTYEYDPDRARQLLEEAGWGDGFEVTIYTKTEPPFDVIGQAVEEDLGAVGIDVTVQAMPGDVYFETVIQNPVGLVVSPWELPYPHGSYVVDGAWVSGAIEGGCCNFSVLRSDEIDALAEEARTTTDVERQIELYKEIDRIAIGEMALWVPLFYPKFAALVSERVRGYEIPGTPTGDTLFFPTYWLADAAG